jgi:hypothetical protein
LKFATISKNIVSYVPAGQFGIRDINFSNFSEDVTRNNFLRLILLGAAEAQYAPFAPALPLPHPCPCPLSCCPPLPCAARPHPCPFMLVALNKLSEYQKLQKENMGCSTIPMNICGEILPLKIPIGSSFGGMKDLFFWKVRAKKEQQKGASQEVKG